MRVLVLNPGSSTLKAAVLVAESGETIVEEAIEWPAGEERAGEVVGRALGALRGETADAVGYRVVHGGSRYRGPARVDDELLKVVVALDALAPLHNRRAAAVMRVAMGLLPGLPHVACFDTAFHADLPEEAWRYPLPMDWVERWGIRRYGFHGLSITWALHRAAELLGRRGEDLGLVVAHLGSGCSVTAVDGGRSVDTSMGFTPYEGLMMGTRSGSVDPGILLRLAEDGVPVNELADGLAHRSGLAAVAGTSDVRLIERRADEGDARASLALEMFARRAAASVAAAATALRRFDALAFTGGIGEHSAAIRADIVRRLRVLGVPQALADTGGDGIIAAGHPAVIVVAAHEDRVIAAEVASVLGKGAAAALRLGRRRAPHRTAG
jgi:acetate kinase